MTWRKSSYSNVNGGECVEVGVWRTSSYSTTNGGSCVEVATAPWGVAPRSNSSNVGNSAATGGAPRDPSSRSGGNADYAESGAAPWRASTHSSGNGGNCVETAAICAAVAVRDTKDHGYGPVLRFTPRAWETFTTTLR